MNTDKKPEGFLEYIIGGNGKAVRLKKAQEKSKRAYTKKREAVSSAAALFCESAIEAAQILGQDSQEFDLVAALEKAEKTVSSAPSRPDDFEPLQLEIPHEKKKP